MTRSLLIIAKKYHGIRGIAGLYPKFWDPKRGALYSCRKGEKTVGAAWGHVIPGFDSIDNQTPENAISVIKEERGKKIGTTLLAAMKKLQQKRGWSNFPFHTETESCCKIIFMSGL